MASEVHFKGRENVMIIMNGDDDDGGCLLLDVLQKNNEDHTSYMAKELLEKAAMQSDGNFWFLTCSFL